MQSDISTDLYSSLNNMIKQVRSNDNKLILENENIKRETYVSAPKIRQLQNQLETL